MIPLTFLYDEYIDWPKLTEQKNPFEYIVPPPTSGVGTIRANILYFNGLHEINNRKQNSKTAREIGICYQKADICSNFFLTPHENHLFKKITLNHSLISLLRRE